MGRENALKILSQRLDELCVDRDAASYRDALISASAEELTRMGIRLKDIIRDDVLIAFFAAERTLNRDKSTDYPSWLQREIVQRANNNIADNFPDWS